MKNIRPLLSLCVAGLVALGFATGLRAQTVELGIAKVVDLKGAARYMPAGTGSWQTLKVGAVLKQGAVIQTADSSYVDLVLNNPDAATGLGNVSPGGAGAGVGGGGSGASPIAHHEFKVKQDAIRVLENSVLSVDKLTITQTGADAVTDTELDLKAGSIFGTVKKLAATSTYEIKIPSGVAAVRGTIYFITAGGVVDVLTGQVVISYVKNGVPTVVTVNAGEQFNPATGQVTPISNPVLEELSEILRWLGIKGHMTGQIINIDHTVYRISPTQGN